MQESQKCTSFPLSPSLHLFTVFIKSSHSSDDDLSAQKALQHIVAGQQSENLLDFDETGSLSEAPSGLAATAALASTPAAASLISGTSSNPLDDLVSIFGSVSVGVASPPPPSSSLGVGLGSPSFGGGGIGGGGMNGMNGFGSLGSLSTRYVVTYAFTLIGATTMGS